MKNMLKLLATLLAVMLALPVTAAAQAGPSRNGAPASYRINPGDDLEIFVWGDERLQRDVRVLPDGTFSFPLVGQVNALNQLPAELEAQIAKALTSQYRGTPPQVTVSVKTAGGMQFSVVGKVRAPGAFTPGRYVNALEAISLAGGPTEFAQLGNVVILRKVGSGLQTVRVRLNDVLRGSTSDVSSATIPQVQGGDTIIVP